MVEVDRKRVLVIDDESSVRESLRMILGRFYEVEVAESCDRALTLLTDFQTPTDKSDEDSLPDVVLLDVIMPGIGGIGLLERLREVYPSLPVIMLTASTTVKTAVKAMKIGAVDYLSKPYDVDELLSLIEETVAEGANGRSSPQHVVTVEHKRSDLPAVEGNYGSMVGEHPVMRELFAKIDQLAMRDTTILITGESGTGKELVAKEIHRRSKRSEGPFVALNCAAIPETLIESELFGHEKGAFTHAVDRRIGHFELADKGTLFLDEIGELSVSVQVKILRFLQEQEFYRVGRSKPLSVDTRVLAATNKNLETAVKEGQFRQDLYYRINVVGLDVPPLRERVEDIPAMLEFFVKRLSPFYGGKEVSFTEEAVKILCDYSWPGNVRELENVTESILALVGADEITPTDLPSRLRTTRGSSDLKEQVLEGRIPFEEAEKEFERDLIVKALEKTNYVQTRAAEVLGISRRILKYKMNKLGIEDQRKSSKPA